MSQNVCDVKKLVEVVDYGKEWTRSYQILILRDKDTEIWFDIWYNMYVLILVNTGLTCLNDTYIHIYIYIIFTYSRDATFAKMTVLLSSLATCLQGDETTDLVIQADPIPEQKWGCLQMHNPKNPDPSKAWLFWGPTGLFILPLEGPWGFLGKNKKRRWLGVGAGRCDDFLVRGWRDYMDRHVFFTRSIVTIPIIIVYLWCFFLVITNYHYYGYSSFI